MEERIPERGKSLNKDSKVRVCLAFSRNNVKGVAGVECMRGSSRRQRNGRADQVQSHGP